MLSSRSLLLVLAALMLGVFGGCDNSAGYSQDTPEDVIRTARLMVERGDVRRLPNLVYADTPEMRKILNRMGVFFENLRVLGIELNKAFPEDIAAIRAEAEKSAAGGKATSLLSALSGNGGMAALMRPRGPGNTPSAGEEMFNRFAKEFFSDPFAFLEKGSERIGTAFVADDKRALLFDEQPILPPIGLVLQRQEDKWFLVLPTNLPGVSNFMPRTKEEFSIWGSLITTFDKAIIDLTKDVRDRSLPSLDQVARKAGEKAFIPAAMVVFAYTRAIDARNKPSTTPAPR